MTELQWINTLLAAFLLREQFPDKYQLLAAVDLVMNCVQHSECWSLRWASQCPWCLDAKVLKEGRENGIAELNRVELLCLYKGLKSVSALMMISFPWCEKPFTVPISPCGLFLTQVWSEFELMKGVRSRMYGRWHGEPGLCLLITSLEELRS